MLLSRIGQYVCCILHENMSTAPAPALTVLHCSYLLEQDANDQEKKINNIVTKSIQHGKKNSNLTLIYTLRNKKDKILQRRKGGNKKVKSAKDSLKFVSQFLLICIAFLLIFLDARLYHDISSHFFEFFVHHFSKGGSTVAVRALVCHPHRHLAPLCIPKSMLFMSSCASARLHRNVEKRCA